MPACYFTMGRHSNNPRPSLVQVVFMIAMKLAIVVLFVAAFTHVNASEAEANADSGGETSRGEAGEVGSSGDGSSGLELPDDAVLLKMKVRELKDILDRKGSDAECLACTSKREYVDRIRETASWPDVTPSPSVEEAPPLSDDEIKKLFDKTKDPKYMADLKEKLRAAGINTDNLFTGKDFNSKDFANKLNKFNTDNKDTDANADVDADSNSGSNADGNADEREDL